MGRGSMGKQIATAPATPRMMGMGRARPMLGHGVPMMRPAAPVMKMAKGGSVTRADGCCMKGKTKGKKY